MGDYELKKKIRKSNMTIETITDLIHEYMYDRLNDSNNSNDGRNIKHVPRKAEKKKMVREDQLRQKQKTTGVSKTKIQR